MSPRSASSRSAAGLPGPPAAPHALPPGVARALPTLRALLARYLPHTDAEWERLAPQLRARRLRRGAHLVRVGGTVRAAAFVVDGVLRRWRPVDGREVTTGFLVEGSFATDLPALCTGAPSETGLQALTPATVLVLPAAALHGPERDGASRWHAAALAAGLALARRREERQVELLTRSPAERYDALVRAAPTLLDRVPHYHVAAYLGIAPESLSRLRRRRAARADGTRTGDAAG